MHQLVFRQVRILFIFISHILFNCCFHVWTLSKSKSSWPSLQCEKYIDGRSLRPQEYTAYCNKTVLPLDCVSFGELALSNAIFRLHLQLWGHHFAPRVVPRWHWCLSRLWADGPGHRLLAGARGNRQAPWLFFLLSRLEEFGSLDENPSFWSWLEDSKLHSWKMYSWKPAVSFDACSVKMLIAIWHLV